MTAPPDPTHKTVVLVVDDNAPMRMVAMAMLRSLGYTPLEADGPPAALALLESRRDVALVLMDIVMPGGMSGIELAAELRRRNLAPQILFTSGFANANQAGELELSDDELLSKPYHKADLAHRIKALLAGAPKN